VATLRFWLAFVGRDNLSEAQLALLPGKRTGGEAALRLMDEHLWHRAWFVDDGPSLADICLFAYTHVAGEGGFDLSAYPAVAGWLDRVRALPGFEAM
jgi:glutathione S-transferase